MEASSARVIGNITISIAVIAARTLITYFRLSRLAKGVVPSLMVKGYNSWVARGLLTSDSGTNATAPSASLYTLSYEVLLCLVKHTSVSDGRPTFLGASFKSFRILMSWGALETSVFSFILLSTKSDILRWSLIPKSFFIFVDVPTIPAFSDGWLFCLKFEFWSLVA